MRTIPVGKYTVTNSSVVTIDKSIDCASAIVELDPFGGYDTPVFVCVLVSDTPLTPQYVIDNGQTITPSTTVYCGNVNQLKLVAQAGGTATVRVFAVVTGQ